MKQLAFMLLALFFFTACNLANKEKEVIKIGAILPLTGDLSSYGVDTKLALELAVKQENEKGGIDNKKIVLIIEDSEGKAENATKAANKLINVDKVISILGPLSSPEVLAIAPIANKNRIPIISPSSTDNAITDAGDFVFRTINADYIENEAFSNFIKVNFNLPRISIIANKAAGTLSYANSFETYYLQSGGKIVRKELYDESQKDFKNLISKVLSDIPDAIYISGYSMEIGSIIRQLKQYNQKIQLLSYQSAEDSKVVNICGNLIDGLIYSSTTLPNNLLSGSRKAFNGEFEKEYSKKPGIFTAEIYDAMNIVLSSYKKTIKSGAALIDSLKTVNNFDGASGVISFDKNGDVHKPIAIYRYSNKTPNPIFVVTEKSIKEIR